MNTRLSVLVGLLGAACAATAAYWFWPATSSKLPKDAFGNPPTPIHVVRIEPVSAGSIEALIGALRPWAPVPLVPNDAWTLDERHTLSWEGDMYDADELMDRLAERIPLGSRVLAVTDQPMHDEEHWWLYGKGGNAAIISTAHLWADDAEGDSRHPLFRERLAKVGVHELGHCLGFSHCEETTCVMRFATKLWMLDATRPKFCPLCMKGWRSWH